jgi:hypothetical protein
MSRIFCLRKQEVACRLSTSPLLSAHALVRIWASKPNMPVPDFHSGSQCKYLGIALRGKYQYGPHCGTTPGDWSIETEGGDVFRASDVSGFRFGIPSICQHGSQPSQPGHQVGRFQAHPPPENYPLLIHLHADCSSNSLLMLCHMDFKDS